MTSIEKGPSGHECDFCSQALGKDYIAFNAQDFTYKSVRGVDLNSAGAWHACIVCADMIVLENWEALYCRAVQYMAVTYPKMDLGFIEGAITDLHSMFRRHRIADIVH